mgnify:CR=1 FL=1
MVEKYLLDSFRKKVNNGIFNNIVISIKNELKNAKYSFDIDDEYLTYILEIAILENCDIEKKQIKSFIKKMGNTYLPPISTDEIQKIHRNSINFIKKIFKDNAI